MKGEIGNQHKTGVQIRTVLSEEGLPQVTFSLDDIHIVFVPDAAVQIALNLLSAAYAARGEQAAFKYAIDNHIEPQTLIKYLRDIK